MRFDITLQNFKTNLELLNLHCWLKANKLSLNVAKTEFMVIGSRQKLLAESHNEINIKLEDQVISNVDHAKSLGLIIDNRLSWSNHVNELCKKVTSAIGALRRIRPLISQSTAVLVYNSLIQPHFDYCSLVWDGLSDQLSDKLQKFQNRAARVIGSCLLWVMSTEISVDMAVDIAVDSRSIVGRQSVDSRSIVGR